MGSFPDCTSLDWKPVVRLARRSSSTALDYFAFTRLLLAGGTIDSVQILKPETVKLMAYWLANSTGPTCVPFTQRLWRLETPARTGRAQDYTAKSLNLGLVGPPGTYFLMVKITSFGAGDDQSAAFRGREAHAARRCCGHHHALRWSKV